MRFVEGACWRMSFEQHGQRDPKKSFRLAGMAAPCSVRPYLEVEGALRPEVALGKDGKGRTTTGSASRSRAGGQGPGLRCEGQSRHGRASLRDRPFGPGTSCRDCSSDSRPQNNLDVDRVGHLDAHELAEGALVRIDVDEALVDAHLPVVVRLRAGAV